MKLSPPPHTHTHAYIYIYIYVCVCMCVCVLLQYVMAVPTSPSKTGLQKTTTYYARVWTSLKTLSRDQKQKFRKKFKNRFSEAPSLSPPLVWFKDELHHTLFPGSLRLMWDPYNLTMNRDAKVTISLWGYKVCSALRQENGATTLSITTLGITALDSECFYTECHLC